MRSLVCSFFSIIRWYRLRIVDKICGSLPCIFGVFLSQLTIPFFHLRISHLSLHFRKFRPVRPNRPRQPFSLTVLLLLELSDRREPFVAVRCLSHMTAVIRLPGP